MNERERLTNWQGVLSFDEYLTNKGSACPLLQRVSAPTPDGAEFAMQAGALGCRANRTPSITLGRTESDLYSQSEGVSLSFSHLHVVWLNRELTRVGNLTLLGWRRAVERLDLAHDIHALHP